MLQIQGSQILQRFWKRIWSWPLYDIWFTRSCVIRDEERIGYDLLHKPKFPTSSKEKISEPLGNDIILHWGPGGNNYKSIRKRGEHRAVEKENAGMSVREGKGLRQRKMSSSKQTIIQKYMWKHKDRRDEGMNSPKVKWKLWNILKMTSN